MFQLKPITEEAIARSLEKAQRYRYLNEPAEAESICLDILEIDPDNQEALITLLLSRTDQFDSGKRVEEARDLLPQIHGSYEQAYYAGIVCERRGKAIMLHGGHGADFMAYDWLMDAMNWYEKAESMRPAGNEDSVLRWNTCARILTTHPEIRREPQERYEPPLE